MLFSSIVIYANSNSVTFNNENLEQPLNIDRSILDNNITPYNSIYFQNINIINANFQNQNKLVNNSDVGLF